jgi:branched-chain amino acid transport system substrate-binding protein
MRGQNIRSYPVAQQWQNGKLVVVSPDKTKTTDAILMPLPAWDKR